MENMKVIIWDRRGSLPAFITAEQVRDKIFKVTNNHLISTLLPPKFY